MFPIINLGPIALQAAGSILLVSLWLGIVLARKFSASIGTNNDAIENSLLIALIAGLLGARIGFFLQNPSLFVEQPLSLVSLTASMLTPSFGLLVGAIAFLISFQKKHLPLLPTLDTLSPLFILVFIGIHLANYANGNAYGLPTTLPWGINLWNATRHPVQIYAILLAIILLGGWLLITRWMTQTGFLHSGANFLAVLAALALITLFTQAFVAQKIRFFNIDGVQLTAFLVLAGALLTLYRLHYNQKRNLLVFVSMGANQKPNENLLEAVDVLKSHFKVRSVSSVYQTVDVRQDHDSAYLNQMAALETKLPYPELVSKLKQIEGEFGRESGNKALVPLDLDVITYGSDVFVWHEKRIPDPGLIQCLYVAQPLAEIAPDFLHPATGQSISLILESIPKEQQSIQKFSEVEHGTQR